ncbi:unnamed protein product [Brassicogethes aeneus]|uniref:Flavin-containing monooxygenase n=1 Tax=Brassicogethes aeneus TaxID=1431903 RepID=A0A9P0AW41_BRAAE|nr:unnamed protein product [Brassicogethes aeneus]
MKIAIIGAGPSGLSAAKNSIQEGHDVDVYEQTDRIGGTWVFTKEVGLDKYGLPIHTSMYEGLRTNLPKELMEFENFSYPENKTSFITQDTVIKYLDNYTNHFQLSKHIKFNHHVIKVDPLPDDKWNITSKNLIKNELQHKIYDAIIVCTGNFYTPFVPSIRGQKNFIGTSFHSHNYRHADVFRNKRVVVLGAGPSGTGISGLLSGVAKEVYISFSGSLLWAIPSSVIKKPRIALVKENSVQFSDGTEANVDAILYCTGYTTTFPFLSKETGIEVDDNWVKPLYKHIININHPTMAIIGITIRQCPFPLNEFQAKFFLAYIKGTFQKTKNEMWEEYNQEIMDLNMRGVQKKNYHLLGAQQGLYLDVLADTANITRIKPVIHRLYMFQKSLPKTVSYKIINENEFTYDEN